LLSNATMRRYSSGDLLLGVASQLKKGRGLCVVAEVAEGDLAREKGLSTRVGLARTELEARLAGANVRGFAHVVVAPSYRAGKSFAIQGLGFGGLEPNTVLLGWPRRNDYDYDDEGDDDDDEDDDDATREAKEEAAKVLVETVCECTAAEKAVLLCLGLEAFPSSDERVEGFVDVWWVVHDGGLLLMIAHLLLRHKTWSGCKLRVHTVLQVGLVALFSTLLLCVKTLSIVIASMICMPDLSGFYLE
jgi:potassium/chloride transporter 4/5/6